MLLDLQRSAGNAAVVHLLRPRASTGAAALAAPGAGSVQRSLWGDDDEDAASDAQSGDGSGSESSWWDWGSGDGSSGSSDGGDGAASGDSGGSSASGSASGDSAGEGGASGGSESSWWDWGSSEPSGPAQGGGDEGGSSWWPFSGGDGGEPEPGQEAPGGDEDTGGHTPEEIERKIAEGDGLTASDPLVPMGGGPAPVAGPGPHGFLDGGRRATIPFGDAAQPEDPAEAWHPHAFTGGGRTGTATWAGGGGAGKGPKGNQGSGSIQSEVAPTYDSRWNGPFSNADVWVTSGTGTADVHRDYVSSTAGDQGNGWWISAAAASALEAHERRHVTAARQVYEATVQPMLDRIAGSAATGKGKTYWASDGITVLSRFIGWEPALKEFKEQDAQWNAPNGQIDQEDYGSAGYPHNMKGPRTIGGKAYDNYLIMNSEPDPT
jgi:hypothetical protein